VFLLTEFRKLIERAWASLGRPSVATEVSSLLWLLFVLLLDFVSRVETEHGYISAENLLRELSYRRRE